VEDDNLGWMNLVLIFMREVIYPGERRGTNTHSDNVREVERFNDFIEIVELVDISISSQLMIKIMKCWWQ